MNWEYLELVFEDSHDFHFFLECLSSQVWHHLARLICLRLCPSKLFFVDCKAAFFVRVAMSQVCFLWRVLLFNIAANSQVIH